MTENIWAEGRGRWMPEGPTPCLGASRGGPGPRGGVATSAPSSVSALDSVDVSGKIGTSAFELSNSENISCVTFLKHKNSRKQGTGTVATCQ